MSGKISMASIRTILGIVLTALSLAACGGGGGDSPISPPPPPPTNQAPTVSAGADQTVNENSTVTLSATANDPNGDALTYSWTQTVGPAVTLNNAGAAQATFTAPDVVINAPESFAFEVTVSDGSLTATDAVNIVVEEPPPSTGSVTVSGTLQYEFVPPNPNCQGLNFAATFARPIRGATVQILNAANSAVLGTTASDENGGYSIAGIPENTQVFVRVLAELKAGFGNTSWSVEVRDNFVPGGSDQDNPNNPPYRNGPLYALDDTAFATGTGNVTRDLLARTGWNGVSYASPRAAGPFSVLDAMYSGMRFVIAADPNVDFDSLTAYWSVNNKLITSGGLDISAGELTASFYRSANRELVLTGDAATDTEEFDDHVAVHEWGHYFEDTLSRSDSTGGPHAIGDRIDARLAWGEGWATALAGMALDEPVYCDTGPAGAGTGFGIGAESGSYDARGWYDEISVVRFLYDLYDTTNVEDGGPTEDDVSLGFAPIYNIMRGAQASTEAFTTVFSFAAELRTSLGAADQARLDAQLQREDMTPGFDIWGVGEVNDANGGRDVLPLYTDIAANGTVTNICMNDDFDRSGTSNPNRTGNKLAERRFLRFNLPANDSYLFTIRTTTAIPGVDDPNDPSDRSDPDMFVFQRGNLVAFGFGGDADQEIFVSQNPLPAGLYVAELSEFRFRDEDSPANFPGQVCFDVSIAPN
ncbi:MAG: hypothetical protein AAGE85_12380 [Pseudomonadota bacterium]